jgi:hypothetical protein
MPRNWKEKLNKLMIKLYKSRKPKRKRLKMRLNEKQISLLSKLKKRERPRSQLKRRLGELILRLKRRLLEP